jgi:integrase
MPRRRSASIQARHQPDCKIGRRWTSFDDATKSKGCTCVPGPLFHVVSRPQGKRTAAGKQAQVREAIGRNREDARRALNKILGEIDDQTYEPPRNLPFAEWADLWHAGLLRPRANTKRVYKGSIEIAKRTFGAKYVRHISTDDVIAFLAAAGDVSSTTKRRHLRVLGSCLEAALRRKPPLAAYNAVRELGEQQRPQAENRKASPFEAAELAKLWTELDEPYLTLAKLSASTGLRQGELVALRWQDVDTASNVVHVRRSYAQGLGFQDPISKASKRVVILTPKVVELLERWRKGSGHLPTPTALVFPGQGRDGQLVDSTIRRALYDAMDDAKIPREWKPDHKLRDFHSFRHSFVAAAIGKGIGLEWIAEQLGHSSISVTERHYKHFMTDARHALAVDLDDALTV